MTLAVYREMLQVQPPLAEAHDAENPAELESGLERVQALQPETAQDLKRPSWPSHWATAYTMKQTQLWFARFPCTLNRMSPAKRNLSPELLPAHIGQGAGSQPSPTLRFEEGKVLGALCACDFKPCAVSEKV